LALVVASLSPQLLTFRETDIVIFGAKPVIWQACCLTLASWGSLGRSRGTLEHKKGDLGVQAWVFIDFRSISGPCFESFLCTFDYPWL
jgi:hypothetical protein